MGQSTFGTVFYLPEQLGDRHNLRLKRHSVNWKPEKFVYALYLISMSISNLISYLKCVNGVEASEVQYSWPSDIALFDLPWEQRPFGMNKFSMNSIIEPGWITPLSRQDILAIYAEDTATAT